MSCCRTCTTLQERSTNAVQQSICRTVCDVESMDFNTTFDGRKCDHTTRIPLCCKTPLERTLGELPCLCSAQNPNMLVSLSVSRGVQAICAEGSTSANSDGDGDDWEKARTADGGIFARLCVRGMRKVCRAQLEKILDVQRRSDTTFPIHAVHSTCMYSNATSASAQLACNMIVQHVQVCWEMRWPRPSHDSWPRTSKGKRREENVLCLKFLSQPKPELRKTDVYDWTATQTDSQNTHCCFSTRLDGLKRRCWKKVPWPRGRLQLEILFRASYKTTDRPTTWQKSARKGDWQSFNGQSALCLRPKKTATHVLVTFGPHWHCPPKTCPLKGCFPSPNGIF